MRWKVFQKRLVITNLAVLAVGWICFWGYGLVVGDVPPLGVVVPLVALSGCAIFALSFSMFVLTHFYLVANGLWNRDVALVDARARQISIATACGVAFLCLLGLTDHSGGGVADTILIPAAILIGCAVFVGLIYSVSAYGSHVFRWQFHSN